MRRRTAFWSLVGVATLAAALVAMWRTSDLGRASADLEHQRQAAKREGVPTEWDDLRRLSPAVPEADNAATFYRRGFAEIHAGSGFQGISDALLDAVIDGKAKPDDLARARKTLQEDARGLAFVIQGSERKALSFDRQWELGPRLIFPEFSDERNAARMLVLRAVLMDDPAAAGRDLGAAARLAAHAGSEPIIISAFVGSSTEVSVEKGIRHLAKRGGAWTTAANSALDAFGPLPDPHRFLAGEVVMGRHVASDLGNLGLRDLGMMSEGEGSLPFAFRFAKFKVVRDAFEAREIEYWRKLYAALPADPLDWRQATRAAALPYPKGPSGALVQMLSPFLETVGNLAAQVEAERRLTRAALDLEEGRQAPLPADPFGAGPLHVRREAKGWTLWSVGPDGVDQNGRPRGRHDESAYDLVVSIPEKREPSR